MMNSKPLIITSNIDPDLDGFSCSIAYSELLNKLGRESLPYIAGKPLDEVRFVIKKFAIKYKNALLNKDSKIVLVDASEIGSLFKQIKPENVVEIIDHRKNNEAHLFANAKIQIEMVGAAATLIAEKFKENGIIPSRNPAILLYCAITSNTLNLKSTTTTNRDLVMTKWLLPIAKLPKTIAHEMFAAKSDLTGKKLFQQLKDDYMWRLLGNQKVGASQLEIINSEQLVRVRKNEIFKILNGFRTKDSLDFNFLSILDLESIFTLFLADGRKEQALLAKLFGLNFKNNIAKYPKLIMRKEIMPQVKAELEKIA